MAIKTLQFYRNHGCEQLLFESNVARNNRPFRIAIQIAIQIPITSPPPDSRWQEKGMNGNKKVKSLTKKNKTSGRSGIMGTSFWKFFDWHVK
jgi:hypothetical protein